MLIKILLLIFDYYYYYYCYYVHSLQTRAGCSAWFIVLGSGLQQVTNKKKLVCATYERWWFKRDFN